MKFGGGRYGPIRSMIPRPGNLSRMRAILSSCGRSGAYRGNSMNSQLSRQLGGWETDAPSLQRPIDRILNIPRYESGGKLMSSRCIRRGLGR
jgi:hypothetical protein